MSAYDPKRDCGNSPIPEQIAYVSGHWL